MHRPLIDTGFLVALYVRGDTLHRAALTWLRQNHLPLQTVAPIIVETCGGVPDVDTDIHKILTTH